MQFSNKDKKTHGQNAKKTLDEILAECKNFSYIKKIIKNYRCGYAEYDDKQFYCNFVIVFEDGKKWIINVTTSFRSDRLKGNQWDSYNIKEIDKSIDKSVLVYPDDLSTEEKESFIAYKMKIVNRIHFSAIDEIAGQNELFELIENYAGRNLAEGTKRDKRGNNFESYISNILNSKSNLEKWLKNDSTAVGTQFNFFEKIVSKFGMESEKGRITKIEATSDKKIIGNLPSSGSPKTDIIATFFFSDGTDKKFTISCKKTDSESVSVHQYSADSFADVLDPTNEKLRELLKKFQAVGNLRDLGEENSALLKNELKPHLKKLVKWVIGGYGGKIRDELQIADYILISDGKEIFIHTTDEYTSILLNPENELNFGTPFRWTYASKRKGKDIQLKCKIIR